MNNPQGCEVSQSVLSAGQKTPTIIEVQSNAPVKVLPLSQRARIIRHPGTPYQYIDACQNESYYVSPTPSQRISVSPTTSQRISNLSQSLKSELDRISNRSEPQRYWIEPQSFESDKLSFRSECEETPRFAKHLATGTISIRSEDGRVQSLDDPSRTQRVWVHVKVDKATQATASVDRRADVKLFLETACQATSPTPYRHSDWFRDMCTQTVVCHESPKPQVVYCPRMRPRPNCGPVRIVTEGQDGSMRVSQPLEICSSDEPSPCRLPSSNTRVYYEANVACSEQPKITLYPTSSPRVRYEANVAFSEHPKSTPYVWSTVPDGCSTYGPYPVTVDEERLCFSRPCVREELKHCRESRPYVRTISETEAESDLDYYDLYLED